MPGDSNQFLWYIRQQLAADKKKSAALGVLLLVLVVFVVHALVSGSKPAGAEASPAAVAVVQAPAAPAAAREVAAPKIRPEPESVGGQEERRRSESPVASLSAKESDSEARNMPRQRAPGAAVDVSAMPRVLQRDLFSTPAWHSFTLARPSGEPAAGAEGAEEAQAPSSFWLQIGAAVGQYQQSREEMRQTFAKEFSELQLQSTMTGPKPLAYVSGRLVGEGDTINGFSVVRIKDRRVAVRKYGHVRELVMP